MKKLILIGMVIGQIQAGEAAYMGLLPYEDDATAIQDNRIQYQYAYVYDPAIGQYVRVLRRIPVQPNGALPQQEVEDAAYMGPLQEADAVNMEPLRQKEAAYMELPPYDEAAYTGPYDDAVNMRVE